MIKRNMRDVMSRERYLMWYENCSNVDDVLSTVRMQIKVKNAFRIVKSLPFFYRK